MGGEAAGVRGARDLGHPQPSPLQQHPKETQGSGVLQEQQCPQKGHTILTPSPPAAEARTQPQLPRHAAAVAVRGAWARSRGTSAGGSGGNGMGKAALGRRAAFVSIINFPSSEEGGSERSPLSPQLQDPASSPGQGRREPSSTQPLSRPRCQLDAAAPFLSGQRLAGVLSS